MPHTAGSGLRSKGFTLFLLVPQTAPSVFGICFADMRKMIGGPQKHLSFAAPKAAFLSKKVDNAKNVCNDGIATQVNTKTISRVDFCFLAKTHSCFSVLETVENLCRSNRSWRFCVRSFGCALFLFSMIDQDASECLLNNCSFLRNP